MAKKKSAPKKKAAKKKVANRAAPKKAAKKRIVRATKKTAKKQPRKKSAGRATKTLGRPKVPGSTKLDSFLKHDYEAQEVFSFLNVSNVKELESHSPQQIITLLTAPVSKTIDKIRKALAINNRCLTGDERFALEFQKSFRNRS